MGETKICIKCKNELFLEVFYKAKGNKDGHSNICKFCKAQYDRDYQLRYKKTIKGSAKIKLAQAKYYQTHKEKRKQYSESLPMKEYRKEYRKQEKYKNQQREYSKRRNKEQRVILNEKMRKYRTIPQNRIKALLRNRTHDALRAVGAKKYYKLCDILGCDISFFKEYLESLFREGMSWGNYGRNGWHIDHIIPCASFDLTDPEQQKRCFHYTNLQPLWEFDNLSKHDKVLVA